MKLIVRISLAGALAAFGVSTMAADMTQARAKANAACAVCHGPNGVATLPGAPNLAGQSEMYLVEQLRNYKSGKRNHEVMGVIAKTLTTEDIQNLSAWYAAIRVSVEPPQ